MNSQEIRDGLLSMHREMATNDGRKEGLSAALDYILALEAMFESANVLYGRLVVRTSRQDAMRAFELARKRVDSFKPKEATDATADSKRD